MNQADIQQIILKNKNTINIVLPQDKLFNDENASHREICNSNKHRVKSLIHIPDICEDLYKLDDSAYDYITTNGDVYVYYGNNMFYKRSVYMNKHNGYIYTTISTTHGNIQRRLHILLAKTFIPNPYSQYLKIVGHKNDDKQDYSLENLYWTNNQENTKDAADKGFNNQPRAEENKNSFYVKVLDKTTHNIVGVYGSITECARCIENINKGFVAKMCKNQDGYNPRSRRYIYQIATAEEFNQNIHLKGMKLTETLPVDKAPKVFLLCNDELGYQKEFDNQVQASKVCGISQAIISRMIKRGDIINGWYCIYRDTIKYTEASSYENMINKLDSVVVENIYTKERKTFQTSAELKSYFGLNGHDVRHYLKTGHTLMNEWKIVSFDNKNNLLLAS